MTDRPNVVLFVMDCVFAANTSLDGPERDTTPFLRFFSNRATVFEQARPPGPKSPGSHVSMVTGLHVEERNVVSNGERLRPGVTVWE